MKTSPLSINTPFPRNRQRNYLSAINRKWGNWTLTQSGGGVAPVVSGETLTVATGGAVGYSLAVLDLTGILAPYINRPVCLSFEIVSKTGGALGGPTMSLNGVYTVSGGTLNIAAVTGTGRYACQFMLSAVTSPTLWIGIGSNGVNDTADVSVVIQSATLEVLSPLTAGPYFEGLSAQAEVFRGYIPRHTLSGNSTGLVTFDRSDTVSSARIQGLLVGDSFGTSSFVAGSWPASFLLRYPHFALFNACTAGVTLQTNAANIASILTLPETDQSGLSTPSFAVLQGGINDALSNVTYGSVAVLTAMMGSIKTQAVAARAAGIKTIICMGIGPASGSVSYVPANGHQAIITAYNGMLESYCRLNGYGFVDTYRLLASELNDISLDPVYDSGDALHPNQWGAAVLAKEVFNVYCELS